MCLVFAFSTGFMKNPAGMFRPKAESKPSLPSLPNGRSITNPVQRTEAPIRAESAKPDQNAAKTAAAAKANIPSSFLRLQNKYRLVTIPTYDGSYQLTHPKILYFNNGWNGYRYWMSMTPYPNEDARYENPSIVVSNDGITWGAPKGLKNPVSGIPGNVKSGGHFSDSHLVMRNGTMELWYRFNPPLTGKGGKSGPDNSVNIYYRKTSGDGIHWSRAQRLLKCKDGHLSLCVDYEGGTYKIWYATYGGDLDYSHSVDAVGWSRAVRCSVPLPGDYRPYHQDIIHYGSKYYLLQTAKKTSDYTFKLFLLTSDDGIRFSGARRIMPSSDKTLWKNVSFYRSTLFVKDNRLHFYISLIIPHLKWYITQTSIPLPK